MSVFGTALLIIRMYVRDELLAVWHKASEVLRFKGRTKDRAKRMAEKGRTQCTTTREVRQTNKDDSIHLQTS